MEDDFPNGDNDVLKEKKSDNEMDYRETIPYTSLKRENDNGIDNRETILYTSQRRESKDEIDKKIYKEPKLETSAEIEKQAIIDEQIFLKNELEQNKVDLKLSKEAEIKKIQNVFDEVKQEEPLKERKLFYRL